MLHVVEVIANNSSVPYFSWFAAKAFSEGNVRLTFIALHSEPPSMTEEMKAYGFDVYWIPFDTTKRTVYMSKAVIRAWRLLRKLRPDVVHTHLFDDSVPVLLAARLAGIPRRVITKQDTSFHWYYAPKGVKFDRFNNRNATHLIAVSEECREFLLEKEKADPKKIRLIHHGIPFDKLTRQSEERRSRLRARFHLEGKIVIGTVARLIEWKGYRYIIGAAKSIVSEFPDVRFLFSGQGDQRPELEQLIREAGLQEHIIFTGWVERDDIPSLYGIMDIYLHAARLEPFGFVIAEAMANSVCVVSTSTGAARDGIRHGENGFLVEQPDAQLIAAQLREALKLSPEERKAIGAKGHDAAAAMFTFELMWRKHLALYRTGE